MRVFLSRLALVAGVMAGACWLTGCGDPAGQPKFAENGETGNPTADLSPMNRPGPTAPAAPTAPAGPAVTAHPASMLEIGSVAPDIEGNDLDGVAFKLSDYRGKVVVLDFWGDW